MKRSDDNRISQIKIPDAAVAIAAAQNSTNTGKFFLKVIFSETSFHFFAKMNFEYIYN